MFQLSFLKFFGFNFFSSLFFIVSCLFLPKLDGIINTRSKGVLDSFNSSVHLLRLTEDQIAKYNAALNQARIQAKKIIDDALAQVEEMRANVKNILEEEDKKRASLLKKKWQNLNLNILIS